jgi:dihydroxyacetone kinase
LKTILDRLQLAKASRVVLMINNLGGTPSMELSIVARHAIDSLEKQGLLVERVYSGTFLSALEMAGISLTVLPVDEARLARLDTVTTAPAWPNAANFPRRRESIIWPDASKDAIVPSPGLPATTSHGRAFEKAVRAATSKLIESTEYLTELDQAVGDGDIGISLSRGSNAVLEAIPNCSFDDPSQALGAIGTTLGRALGGTSGPLYSIMLLTAAACLKQSTDWAAAFEAGVKRIGEIGGAKIGDRTMLDALIPASQALSIAIHNQSTISESLAAAATAAEAGAAATSTLYPKRGRSSYLGDRALGHPDPGAVAVSLWLRAIATSLKES